MSLACYIHIPYCIQKCLYCDFTTFTKDKLPLPEVYTSWVKQEIKFRHQGLKAKNISSIYFGGGTPSIIPAKEIVSLIKYLNKYFLFDPDIEISIEINPGTLTKSSLDIYKSGGVNRFSVGVQTFREDLLKLFNREHKAKHTKNTLSLLEKSNTIFSTDLLFALNHQSIKDLKKDIDTLLHYNPHHISTYYLTLPQKHILQKNRPEESVQVKMFEQIAFYLNEAHFTHYEISNFARNHHYSKHNLSYWSDKNYWGLGLSSHSFLKINNKRVRFWNPKSLSIYSKQVDKKARLWPFSTLPKDQIEELSPHEAVSDFCHTALRTRWGIDQEKLQDTFGPKISKKVLSRLKKLREKKWIHKKGSSWSLFPSSYLISNAVFREMTFLKEDLT